MGGKAMGGPHPHGLARLKRREHAVYLCTASPRGPPHTTHLTLLWVLGAQRALTVKGVRPSVA
jgi:hypothetical protein